MNRLNQLPEEMVILALEAARREDPANGFCSSMHTDDATGLVDKLLIYAWGPSAQELAQKLKLVPVMPAWAGRRDRSTEQQEQLPGPTKQITASSDQDAGVASE